MACEYGLLTVRQWRAGLMLLTWHCCVQLLLILLHPFTYSRGLACLLPGVTLVAEHNVGAHAALPRLVQDWALHGKKMHTCCCLCDREQQGCVLCCVHAEMNNVSFTMVNLPMLCFETDTDQKWLLLHCCLITERRVRSVSFEWVLT